MSYSDNNFFKALGLSPNDNASEGSSSTKTCKSCGVIGEGRIVPMPIASIHYAQLRCNDCNSFISWIRKPENQLRQEKRSQQIKDWLNNPKLRLSEWEREFLTSIATATKLSPKQQSCFNKIQARLGGGAK